MFLYRQVTSSQVRGTFAISSRSGCSQSTGSTVKSGSAYTASGTVTVPTLATNVVRDAGLGWKLSVTGQTTAVGVVIKDTANISLPGVRYECDNMSYISSQGCAFSTMPGLVTLSKSAMPNIASHVLKAQASGLPGKVGTTGYLTRATDTVRRANRAVSCPSRLKPTSPVPSTWGTASCDEYPFAVANQGAAANTRIARSFSGCRMADPARTGSTGFSRCYVPTLEQSRQGGAISNGFLLGRVRIGQKFLVGFGA